MKLYHTGTLAIPEPDVHYGRKNADFGQGFYLTPDREFACRWAGGRAVINTYELDTDGLTVRRFERNAEWLDHVMNNRRAKDGLCVDVVIGPIANDTIFDTFGILGSGVIEPEGVLKLMALGPEYTQVAVKTERAAKQLRWLGAEEIEGPDEEQRRREQEEYMRLFAAALQEILGES